MEKSSFMLNFILTILNGISNQNSFGDNCICATKLKHKLCINVDNPRKYNGVFICTTFFRNKFFNILLNLRLLFIMRIANLIKIYKLNFFCVEILSNRNPKRDLPGAHNEHPIFHFT